MVHNECKGVWKGYAFSIYSGAIGAHVQDEAIEGFGIEPVANPSECLERFAR